jgi:hypothetical protein
MLWSNPLGLLSIFMPTRLQFSGVSKGGFVVEIKFVKMDE